MTSLFINKTKGGTEGVIVNLIAYPWPLVKAKAAREHGDSCSVVL